MKKKNRWPFLYGIVLTVYAVFTLLDAFVIPSELVSVEELADIDDGEPTDMACLGVM